MSFEREVRGEATKKSGVKKAVNIEAGEFEAQKHDPEKDERRMKKILQKEKDNEAAEAEAEEENAVVGEIRGYLIDFADYDEEESLFKFFHSLCSLKDFGKINSVIEALPEQLFFSIGKKHLEIIRKDLSGALRKARGEKEVAALRREFLVLDSLTKAVDKLSRGVV